MLLPKGGVSWKSAKAKAPPWRVLLSYLAKARFIAAISVTVFIVFAWRTIGSATRDLSSMYCFGPSKPPSQMSINEMVTWNQHLQTPVIFNHHKPLEVNSTTISSINLNDVKSTPQAFKNQERVLLVSPLRNAAPYLLKYFELISQLTYPHHLIDLAFLVSDSNDDTLAVLTTELARIQNREDEVSFRSATIVQKDFGADLDMGVQERHKFEAQGSRRKLMGKARNYLLSATMKPEHSWVYWRDVDIVESPTGILEDFMMHDKDILVPNIWFHRWKDNKDVEGKFDYNSWVESPQGLKLAASLPKDTVLAEGYEDVYKTGRKHMARLGDWRNNPHEELALDGIGGVNVLVKADVHRAGINFPCYSFENQAETEGFGKMAKRAGYEVVGLPNYVVWHIDTEEKKKGER